MSGTHNHLDSVSAPVSREVLHELRQFDTCAIANAIEGFGVRLRNQGFTGPGLRCVTGGFPRVLGYAATCRVRTSDPPMTGNAYMDRTDWWGEIQKLPLPRIAVIEDVDAKPGNGGSIGQVHAAILQAFGCHAVITNGAVRDVPDVGATGFTMFAAAMAVSHSYVHIVDYGEPVKIFGLEVRSGDLLFADCHGVISIPRDLAAEVAAAAGRQRQAELRIIEACRSVDFTEQRLLHAIQASETR